MLFRSHGDAGLTGRKIIVDTYVDMHVTAAELFPEKTAQRLTVPQHMLHVMLQRTLLQQVLLISVRFSYLTPSVLHSLLLSWLIHSVQERSQMMSW